MLFQIGSVQLSHLGLAPYEFSREAGSDFAEKDVYGALKPAEAVGEGDDVIKISCRLFSMSDYGEQGLATIETLDAMRIAQQTVIVVRGDGKSYGWRRITNITEKGRILDLSGVGKAIDYEITLKKSQSPNGIGKLSQLYGIIQGAF